MKLPYTPVVNKINGKYYVIPAKAGTPYRTIIRCDERLAGIVNLLSSNIGEARMIEKAKELLADVSLSDIVEAVRKVRSAIGSHDFKERKFEVIDL